MSLFRRKGKADDAEAGQPDDAVATEATEEEESGTGSEQTETGTLGDRDTSEAEARRFAQGPLDVSEADADEQRIDLGALQLPGRQGMELRLEVEESTKRVIAVTVAHGRGSSLQMQAFAAPRTLGVWDDVRGEIAAPGHPPGRNGRRGPRSLRPGADRAHPGAHARRTERAPAQPFRRRRRSALVPPRRLRRPRRARPGRVRPAWRRSCGRRWWCAAARRCHRATCCRCACPPAPRPRRGSGRAPPEGEGAADRTGGTARSTTSSRSNVARRSPSGVERGPRFVGPPARPRRTLGRGRRRGDQISAEVGADPVDAFAVERAGGRGERPFAGPRRDPLRPAVGPSPRAAGGGVCRR